MITIAAGVFLGLVLFSVVWPRRHSILAVAAGAVLNGGPIVLRVLWLGLMLLVFIASAAGLIALLVDESMDRWAKALSFVALWTAGTASMQALLVGAKHVRRIR